MALCRCLDKKHTTPRGRTENYGAGVSQSQVRRCLESLQEKGFIKVHGKRGQMNKICLALEEVDHNYEKPGDGKIVIDIFDKTIL